MPQYTILQLYQDTCVSELTLESFYLSLKTMQTHVNEVTVIHTLVNTLEFLLVISKHGTGLVGHKGRIKKEDQLWRGASWVIGPLEDTDRVQGAIKLNKF